MPLIPLLYIRSSGLAEQEPLLINRDFRNCTTNFSRCCGRTHQTRDCGEPWINQPVPSLIISLVMFLQLRKHRSRRSLTAPFHNKLVYNAAFSPCCWKHCDDKDNSGKKCCVRLSTTSRSSDARVSVTSILPPDMSGKHHLIKTYLLSTHSQVKDQIAGCHVYTVLISHLLKKSLFQKLVINLTYLMRHERRTPDPEARIRWDRWEDGGSLGCRSPTVLDFIC